MKFNPSGDLSFQLDNILNNGLEFQDNVRGGFIEFETTGEEQQLQHSLGYVPVGWITVYRDNEVELWAGSQQWTKEFLYLQSSVKNVTVRIFAM